MKKVNSKLTNIIFFFIFTFIVSFLFFGATIYKASQYKDVTNSSILRFAITNIDTIEDNSYYALTVDDITYNIHTYVFNGDQTWSENKTFGDENDVGTSSTDAQNMVMVVVNGNLTIEEGTTVTAFSNSYGGPKGMFLYVTGQLTNNGTISMTGKGGKHPGEDVYLWDDEIEGMQTVPAVGALGGAGTASSGDQGVNANPGEDGYDRETGGGGGGANTYSSYSNGGTKGGAGGTGTSYSGGAGGGGGNHGWNGNANKYIGGSCYGVNSDNRCQTGVGVTTGGVSGSGVKQTNLGTGGLLIIFASYLYNSETGIIESQGISPNPSVGGQSYSFAFGGASGGGSINAFASAFDSEGEILVDGGVGIRSSGSTIGRRSKSGDGGVGTFSFFEIILDENLADPKLKELTVDVGTLSPSFDPDKFIYNLALGSEQTKVNVTASALDDYVDDMTIVGTGEHIIKAGSDKITVSITSKYGFVNVYTINTTRPPSSYKYLDKITLDGKDLTGFSSTKTNYEIYLEDFQDEVEIGAVLGRPSQVVTNIGKTSIGTGVFTVPVTVTAEDGSGTTTYNLNFHRNHNALLKSIKAVSTLDSAISYQITPVFNPNTFKYYVRIPADEMNLDIETLTYDEESVVTITGNTSLNSKSGDIIIDVTEPNSTAKKYTLHYVKDQIVTTDVGQDFGYTGKYQTFTAPSSGLYKIELWGAGQGNYQTGSKGFGGYTSGEIPLKEGETLYIYVGQRGTVGADGTTFNGGTGTSGGYPGAGATDVRLAPGSSETAWREFDSLKTRIMVAGGAGTGSTPGDAGGLTGYAGGANNVGTQTSGGAANGYTAGGFGFAGGGCGGGGGYYGGGGSACATGAGGGSSFISGHKGSNAISALSTESNIIPTGQPNHYSDKIFINTVMIDGKGYSWTDEVGTSVVGMPKYDGTEGTMTGNTGDGHARITLLTPASTNYLINLESDKGTMTPDFEPDTFTYDLELNSEESKINLTAFALDEDKDNLVITGDGEREVVANDGSLEVVVTSKLGYVTIYTINTHRAPSSYKYLDGIKIDGEEIAGFNPTTLTYDVYLDDFQDEIEVEAIRGRTSQVVTNEGKLKTGTGLTVLPMTVTAEDGSGTTTYNLRLHRNHTALLKSIKVFSGSEDRNEFELEPEFNHSTYSYDLKLPYNEIDLDIITEVYDDEAKVTITGEKLMLNSTGDITITVDEPNVPQKVYKIHYSKELASTVKRTYDFDYTGDYQTFIAPYSGTFIVELWGAQGGGNGTTQLGGLGGYTKGEIKLNKGDELYIYVGATTKTGTGGYNGGGTAVGTVYGGGGATDVRLVSGTWNTFDSLKSRIMVASGGGGHGMSYNGGAAGGLVGYNGSGDEIGYGGTQTSGGRAVANAGGDTAGKFGIGGTGSWSSEPLGGGGAGYYGGSSGGGTNNNGSGGGGSSYISGHPGSNSILESSTSSSIVHNGLPTHYSGISFTNTVMIDGKGYEWLDTNTKGVLVNQPNPNEEEATQVGQKGNGFARITPTSYSRNNYLTDLKSDVGTLTPAFDPLTNDYKITLDKYTKEFTLSATLSDETATVTGLGHYDIKVGETKKIPVTVTASSGDTRIYNVEVTRLALLPGEHSSKLIDLVLEDNLYEMTPSFEPETYDYEITIPYNMISVNVDYTAFDPDATITVSGNGYIKTGKNGEITVTVTNPYCASTTYKIKVYREGDIVDSEWGFDYTGEYQTFIAPYTGYYQMELWGAAGQYYSTYASGLGAYTKGKIWLTKGTTLYVYVGNRVTTSDGFRFNGGGQGGSAMNIVGAGGGATDIRVVKTSKGSTWNEFNSLKSRIMVAAGGGGHDRGGAGGALTGIDGSWHPIPGSSYRGQGATQVSGGAVSSNGGTAGGFGYGGTGRLYSDGHRGGGGGGGWYGGSAAKWHAGGGGGSSYISGHMGSIGVSEDSTEDNVIPLTKTAKEIEDSYSYTGYVFTDTEMIAGNELMPGKISGYMTGNNGNGYARITKLPDPSTNNFLTSITVKVNGEERSYTPDYDLETLDYYIDLAEDETRPVISARPEDSKATIEGLGEILVPAGGYDDEGNIFEVKVTAESGDERIYRLHFKRPASDNPNPENIVISGLVSSLCNVEGATIDYCKLDKEFDPNTFDYYMTVPARVKQLWFDVIKGHDFQRVTGDGKVSLDSWDNVITITVDSEQKVIDEEKGTSESVDGTRVYRYHITRDMTGNTDLIALNVYDPEFDLHYDPDIFSYYLTVPNEYETFKINDEDKLDESLENILQIYAQADDSDATLSIIPADSNALNTGMNEIDFVVLAPNGNVGIYKINVYREKNTNVFLSKLEVKDSSKTYDLSPTFDKLQFGPYQVEVENDVANIEIVAEAEVPTTSVVTGDVGNLSLNVGNNLFNITVTAEDGNTETYQVNVTRKKNNNANLASITVEDDNKTYDLDKTFDKDTLDYQVVVDEGVSKIKITATTEVDTTTYRLLDNDTLRVGDNLKRVMAIAEDGTTKTYNITITRPANTNNYLSELEIKDKDDNIYSLTPEFISGTWEENGYTLEVENEIDNITVSATKSNELSSLSGTGNYGLQVGTNQINVKVKAETGDEKVYVITVTRKPNSDAHLSMITTTRGSLNQKFDEETKEYYIGVDADVNEVTLTATPKVKTTKVTPSTVNLKNLETGTTEVEFVTLAEDGVTTLTYKVKVIKGKSTNAKASMIIMEEGSLRPLFDSSLTEYETYVPYEVTAGTFHVTLEDKKSAYEILNNGPFVVGENEVTIRVTSESGETNDYIIKVHRQAEGEITSYLRSLTTSTGKLNPKFNKTITYYEMEVPYKTSKITFWANAQDRKATVTGAGAHELKVGKNVITITVTGVDGQIRDYQIVVTRKRNNEARLDMLSVINSSLTPSFDSDTYEYDLTVRDSAINFDKIIPKDTNASYEITGNYFTNVGNYDVVIKVTAQDEETTKEYTLHVDKKASYNNNLDSLEVVGYKITPDFNSNTTLYTLTVPNDVNSVLINATSADSNATISGDGNQMLSVGVNNLVVEVTSEAGTKKAYTISITKEGSNNTNLKDLIVNNGVKTPDYSDSVNEYNVTIPYEEKSVDLTVQLAHDAAYYVVSGNNNLQVGLNKVLLIVTAEDGTTRTITLNVTREEIVTALLEDIQFTNYKLNETFNSNNFNYTLTVNNETDTLESLGVLPIPLDKKATYEVKGNSTITSGTGNIIEIEVTSSDKVTKEIYTINVERLAPANNYLDYLYTDKGDLTPTFKKDKMIYSIDVPNDVTTIELIGEVQDKTSNVIGLGTKVLSTGTNEFEVVVTSNNGIKRIYYVNVNRAASNDNYLLTLKVSNGQDIYTLNPTFDKDTLEYTVDVPVGLPKVELSGTISENATVTGLGSVTLHGGENEVEIVITSESGALRTYKVVINRPKSDNAMLIDLVPSVGALTPGFTYNGTEYTLYLDSAASTLGFSYSKEDIGSTVTGTDTQLVPDGTTTREIVVTAEDGVTTRTYTVTVVKERSDNANLASLEVKDYPFSVGETFDKDTLEYHIHVPNSKKTLDSSDIIATTEDKNARITMAESLPLSTKYETAYIVTVTAPDKFTTKNYKILVTRDKGSESKALNIEVNQGRLTSIFTENTYEYEWKIPKELESVTSDMVSVTLKDPNATVIMPDELNLSDGSVYSIAITSEDGSDTTIYNLNISKNLSSVAYLTNLTVDKGKMTPEFAQDTFTYNVYEYDDVTSINVDATYPPNVYINSGIGEVTLTDDLTIHDVVIEAEDGTVVTYTLNIYKNVKKDGALKKLGLNNLSDVTCIGGQCVLDKEFDKDTLEYSIKVPNDYEKLSVYYEKLYGTENVVIKVKGEVVEDNTYTLPVGLVTPVEIEVYDAFDNLARTYILNVTRCKSDNNYLKSLVAQNKDDEEIIYELDKEFNKNVMEYTITIPEDIEEVKFVGVPEDENAKVEYQGYNYLQDGMNDATIVVTSPSGERRTYIVHILRESLDNSYLQNITVSTGTFWNLEPKFSPTTFTYTATVEAVYDKVKVEAVPMVNTTTIEGTGDYELKIGVNTVVLKTKTEKGKSSEYTVNIIKLVSSNTNIANLIVEEGNLKPSFDKGKTKYEVNVASNVSKLTMHVTLEDKTSSYIVTGNENLVSGDNTVNIIVMNSNKTASKTYQLIVHKAKDTNSLLKTLRVYDETKDYDLTPSFDNNTLEYNVTVPHNIEKISIEAPSSSDTSLVTGDGLHYLEYGNNLQNVVVTAEDGTTSIYKVNIYREYDLRLKTLASDNKELETMFNSDTNTYQVNVANDVDEITLIGTAISNKVTVEGNGTYTLNPKDNNLEIKVKDPDGHENVYTINVIRAQNSNNYLKEVTVTGFLNRAFDRDVEEYLVDVRKDVTALDFTSIVKEVESSTYEILNNSLSEIDTENVVTIRVKAEDGTPRDYVFKVYRRQDEFFSNRLLSLTVSEGTLSPDFDPDTNNYTVTVPNSINEITIEVIKEDVYATVTGAGRNSLAPGKNVLPVTVTNKEGHTNTYNVIVYRNESPDATLKKLVVKNHNYIPIFNKLREGYTMTVGSDVTALEIEALPTDPNAKVKISGDKLLVTGENTVTIKVTAPDGVTTKTYTITVTKGTSKNNFLSSLEVVDHPFKETFDKGYLGPYTVDVANDVNSVYIKAIPEESTSTVVNDGIHTLKTGKNTITIDVINEAGAKKTYTIIINKASSTDGTLKDILLSDGTLDPVFDKNTYEYRVLVPSELETITVTGVLNSVTSSIKGNGTYNLIENETEVKLVVTSEDGNETEYIVKIEKDITTSSKLAKLIVKDGELYPHFHKLITGYTIYVPNEVTSLDLDYAPEDDQATSVITGNENFKVGTNKVTITVTSRDGSSTTTYEISVIRQTMAATYLQTLEVEGYPLKPTFDKEKMYYEVAVPQDVETVNIIAKTEDSTAKITGTGIQSLVDGENKFYVTVESTSGVIRSYQIVVTRQMSSENKLLTLTHDVGTILPEFNPDTNEYTIIVPAGTKEINLDGTVSDKSTVTGLGKVELTGGEQERLITVTSQSGETNVYTIKINRPLSNNTELIDLIPSAGELTYSNDILDYELVVDDNVNVMSFTATPVDENATVEVAIPVGVPNEGEEQQKIIVTDLATIDYGENKFIITVTAEDGVTKRVINLKVIKHKDLISITASDDEILLAVDEEKELTYTINPTDTSYQDVEWVSLDESIATVDSNGKVTAVGVGGTQVKVVSTHDNTIFDIVNVNVISKYITSSVYDIKRFETKENNEVDHVIGIEPLTILKDFILNFDNNPSMLHVYDSEGNKITDENVYIGTKMIIKLELDDRVLDELTIVVRGDLTGDGEILGPDFVKYKNYMLGNINFDYLEFQAAELTGDGEVLGPDYVKMKNYMLGNITSLNY